jgi:hypothetical protein
VGGAVDGVARARRRFLRLHALEFLLRELSLEQDVRRAVLPVAASRAASLAPTPRLGATATAAAAARGAAAALSPRGSGLGSRRSSRSGQGLAGMVVVAGDPFVSAGAAVEGLGAEEDEGDEGEPRGAAADWSERAASASPYRPGFDLEDDLERMMIEEDEDDDEGQAELEEGLDAGEAGGTEEEQEEEDDGVLPPLPGAAAAVPRLAALALPSPPPLLGLSSVAFGSGMARQQEEADEDVGGDGCSGDDDDGGGRSEEDQEEQPPGSSSSSSSSSGYSDSDSRSGGGDDNPDDHHHRHPRWSVASHAAAAAARVGPPSAAEAAARAAASAAAETLSAYRLQRRRHPLYRDPALHLGAAELLLALLPAAGAPAGVGAVGDSGGPAAPSQPLPLLLQPPPPPPLCAAAAAASAQLDALLLPTDAADTRLEAACAALRAHLSHPDNAALVSRLWQRAALAQGAVDKRRRHRLLSVAAASGGGNGSAGVEAGAPLRRLLKLTAATLFEAAAACYRPGGEISRGQFGTIFAATVSFRFFGEAGVLAAASSSSRPCSLPFPPCSTPHPQKTTQTARLSRAHLPLCAQVHRRGQPQRRRRSRQRQQQRRRCSGRCGCCRRGGGVRWRRRGWWWRRGRRAHL